MAENKPLDDASFIFRFLGDIWLLLPYKDKRILSNFWASLIKITGDIQSRAFELDLSVSVHDIPVYSNYMWNSFEISEETILNPSALEEYPYSYFIGDSRIISIPTLQDRIDNPNHLLVEDIDYIVLNNMIYFKEDPSQFVYMIDNPVLWAKDTLLNKETPYRNFGALIDLYQENSEDYLRVLQGVWYAYWNGPSITNIRTSLYLLFALPTASTDGRITDLYEDDDEYKHVELTNESGEVIDYMIPKGLDYAVTIGQTVKKFDILSTGINVIDKETNPDFMSTEVGRQGIQKYLTQHATKGLGDTDETKAMTLLAEHLWVAQTDSNTFITEIDIPAIRNFLDTIKPLYTDFVFQMLRKLEDYLDLSEDIVSKNIFIDITVNTENTPVNIIDNTRYDDYVNLGNNDLDIDMDSLFFTEDTQVDVYDNTDTLIDSFEASI